MIYRNLGKTDIRVSEIGFGTWGIGGDHAGAIAYGATDDAISIQALEKALECGINFFDTADLYGYGHSERLLGEVFQQQRKNIILASKAGFLDFQGNQDFSAQHLRNALEKSLKRLNTNYLDVYQLHSPKLDFLRANPAVWQVFNEFKQEGKIRATGISARSPEDALVMLDLFQPDVLQINFNFVDQRAMDIGLFEKIAQTQTGLIIRTPLCFGFLTGKYAMDDQFLALDHRKSWSASQLEKWSTAYLLFKEEEQSTSLQTHAQVALRFCLSFGEVSTVIPGMLSPQHVIENAMSSDLGGFDQAALAKFHHIFQQHEFFVQS